LEVGGEILKVALDIVMDICILILIMEWLGSKVKRTIRKNELNNTIKAIIKRAFLLFDSEPN